jgi:hypothetical protein
MNNFLSLLAPQPPRFPTFSELVEEHAKERQSASTQSSSLFHGLIGNPAVLFEDLLADPSRYEDGVAELLQLVIGGVKKLEDLTPEEMQLLDRAAFEFAQAPKKTPKPLSPAPKEEPEEFEELYEKDAEVRYHESSAQPDFTLDYAFDGAAGTEDKPPSFWWKK